MMIAALFISIANYMFFLAGLILIFINTFKSVYGRIFLKRRLNDNRDKNNVLQFMDRLVYLSYGAENKGFLLAFISLLMLIFVFIFSSIYCGVFVSLVTAILTALIPTISLVSKIENLRNRGSREGLSFVTELNREYLIRKKNIYLALEAVSKDSSNYPVCAKYSSRLVLRIRNTGNLKTIHSACVDFKEGIDASWAKQLSVCIENGCLGLDVSKGLEEVLREIEYEKESFEKRKRGNNEALRMSSYLTPFMFASSIAISKAFLGYDLKRLITNQFSSSVGFMLFSLIFLLYVYNSLFLSYITRR